MQEKNVQHVYVGNFKLNKNRKRQGRNLKKQNRKQLLKFMCEIGGGEIMMLSTKTNIFFNIIHQFC